jgi:hypothetical protein
LVIIVSVVRNVYNDKKIGEKIYGDIVMKNPWEDISLSDYENHMSLEGVRQLQQLNYIMKEQFDIFPVSSAMVLGVAGGNGLEHVNPKKYQKIYGVDVNQKYLDETRKRFSNLGTAIQLLCVDLLEERKKLPEADLLIANLLIEYIGYESFNEVVMKANPKFISSVIQINESKEFVSDSPYLHVFDGLESVHCQVESGVLSENMANIGYANIESKDYPLPNGKKLVRLDYMKKQME